MHEPERPQGASTPDRPTGTSSSSSDANPDGEPQALEGESGRTLPSLRRSLVVNFLALILLPVLVLGTTSYIASKHTVDRLVHQQLHDVAELVRVRVTSHVDVTDLTAKLADKLLSFDVVSIGDRERLRRLFQTVLEQYPQLRNAYVGYPDGHFFMVTSTGKGFAAERVASCKLPHAYDDKHPIEGDPKALGYDPTNLAPLSQVFPFAEDRQSPSFSSVLAPVVDQIAELAATGGHPSTRFRLIDRTLRAQLRSHRFTRSIYVGFSDGGMLLLRRLEDGSLFSEWQWHHADGSQRLQTRAGRARWTDPGPPKAPYDPRPRPWYTKAVVADGKLSWTDVYRGKPIGNPIISAAIAIPSPATAASDQALPKPQREVAVAGFDFDFKAFSNDPNNGELLVPPRAIAVLYETRAGTDGDWIPAEPPLSYYDPRTRGWWAAKDKKGPHWTDVYTFASSGQLGITVARRVIEPGTRRLKGVIGVDIVVDQISQFLAQVSKEGVDQVEGARPKMHSFIVTATGRVVGYSSTSGEAFKKRAGKMVYDFDNGVIDHSLIRNKIEEGKDALFEYDHVGRAMYARMIPIDITGEPWFVWVITSREDFMGGIDRMLLIALAIGLLASIVAVFSALRLRGRIARPLGDFLVGFEHIGAGRYFDVELPERVGFHELRRLRDGFAVMLRELRESHHLRRYVSRAASESIRASRDQSEHDLGGSREVRTIWFSDIRGFTAYSEKHSPDRVIAVLNRYFKVEVDCIHRHGGDIDKFIGDGVMAIFHGKDQVARAVQASLDIVEAFKELNEGAGTDITIGVGINTGDVVVGNMGAADRMDFTVIGDNVNVAARLCDKALPYQVLLSETSYREVRDRTDCEEQLMRVKGKSDELKVFAVNSWTGGAGQGGERST